MAELELGVEPLHCNVGKKTVFIVSVSVPSQPAEM